MRDIWVEFDHKDGHRVGMVLPEEQGFAEAKQALTDNITSFVYLKLAGSRIKWFMQKVESQYKLVGKVQ